MFEILTLIFAHESWKVVFYATGIPACRKLFRSNEFVLKTLKLSCSLPEVKYASSRKYLQHALKSNLAFSRYSFLFAATCRKCFSQESLLRNIIIFFVAKSKSFFLRSHKKIFAFFLCILQKWFVQLAKKSICDFQLCEDSKSKQTLMEGTKMWTTYLPFPQKLLWKKQQNIDAVCKKDYVRPHINLLGTCMMWYLHKADNLCCERTQRFVLDQATTLGERNQPFALDARKFFAVCRY